MDASQATSKPNHDERTEDQSSRRLMTPFGKSIWYADGPHVSFYGFDYPTRMVIIKINNNEAWLWSPIEYSDELASEIQKQCGGGDKYITSPNYIHNLYLKQWSEKFPEAKLYAPPGLPQRKVVQDITFDSELSDSPPEEYSSDIDQVIFRGSLLDEVVFFHRASSTVIFGDLIQRHDPASCVGFKGWLMKMDDLVGPTGSTPREWRWSFWCNRKMHLAREALDKVVHEWKPKQLLIAHGECSQEGATEIVVKSLSWMDPSRR